jgi:hypothetical protein
MISESTQLLSTAHHVLNPRYASKHPLFRPTHENHPCNVWLRESDANYRWLYRLLEGYLEEYDLRFNQPHKFERTRELMDVLRESPFKRRTKGEP